MSKYVYVYIPYSPKAAEAPYYRSVKARKSSSCNCARVMEASDVYPALIEDWAANMQHDALKRAIECFLEFKSAAKLNSRYGIPAEADNALEWMQITYDLMYPETDDIKETGE